MTYGPAVNMEEPKKKLRNLKAHIPDAEHLLQPFGEYLADNLNAFMLPVGFIRTSLKAIYELRTGYRIVSREKVWNSLVGQPLIIYRMLEIEIPFIARTVFEKEFADAVIMLYKEVQEESKYSIMNRDKPSRY